MLSPLLSKLPKTAADAEKYLDLTYSFLHFMLTCGTLRCEQDDMIHQLACLFRRYPGTLSGTIRHLLEFDPTYRDLLSRILFDMSNYHQLQYRFNMHLRHAEHISINRWGTTLHPHWRSIVCSYIFL